MYPVKSILSYIIILLMIILNSAIAAQAISDSLLESISRLEDTTRVRILTENCWKYRSTDPERAIKYGLTALSLTENMSRNKHLPEIYNYLGIIQGNMGNLDSAYTFYYLGLEKADEYSDSNQIAYSLNNIGDYYFKKALFSTALGFILKANEIFEKISNNPGLAYSFNDIGEIYLKQNNFEKASEYFSRSKDLRLSMNDDRGVAKSLINLATTYLRLGDIELAKETYNSAVEYSRTADYIKGESWILAGLSEIYFYQKQYGKALENRFEALEIDKKIGNKYGEIINLNQIGRIYLSQGNLNNAEKYLEMARSESDKTGHLDQLMLSHDYLRELSLKVGDYKNAYKHLSNYETVKDSIYSLESANQIADLQTAFLTEKKDRENEILRKDLDFEQTTNKYLIIISILVSGILFLLYSRFRAEHKSLNKLNEINQKLKELNAQKNKMFSIIGHDLKNPAGALYNYLDYLYQDYENLSKEEIKDILQNSFNATERLQKQLLDLLEWGEVSNKLIDFEIEEIDLKEAVEEICELYRPTAEIKNITLDHKKHDCFIKSDKRMITTVLRNLVDNSIKFTPEGGTVTVSYHENENNYYISTKDTGVGIKQDKIDNLFRIDMVSSTRGTAQEKGSGLGLLICSEFVKKCDGVIEVKSKIGEGSEFIVKLPKT